MMPRRRKRFRTTGVSSKERRKETSPKRQSEYIGSYQSSGAGGAGADSFRFAGAEEPPQFVVPLRGDAALGKPLLVARVAMLKNPSESFRRRAKASQLRRHRLEIPIGQNPADAERGN